MLPVPMKSATKSGVKPMTKGNLINTLAGQHEVEKESCSQHDQHFDESCPTRGEEDWPLYPSRLGSIQSAHEASHESWQEGGFRQGHHGKSQTGKENCQGLPSGGFEKEHLSKMRQMCSFVFRVADVGTPTERSF